MPAQMEKGSLRSFRHTDIRRDLHLVLDHFYIRPRHDGSRRVRELDFENPHLRLRLEYLQPAGRAVTRPSLPK